MARWVGFVGPSYTSRSKIAAYDRTVNWYVESIESGTGTARYVLYPTPGYQSAFTLGDSPGRAAFSNNPSGLFFVAGTSFYHSSTLRGTVSNTLPAGTDGPVYMTSNGDAGQQVFLASDSTTYIYNYITHTFAAVGTATSATEPYTVAFINGYFLRLDPALSQVEFSALEDGTSWDALDVFQRNDATDRWVRIISYHKELWCFGAESTSVYYNDADDPDLPFKPIPSVFVQVGIAARASACIVDGQLLWVGQSAGGGPIVYRANGYTPERISTFAVEEALEQLGRDGFLPLGEGTTYQENGHSFYVLSFAFAGFAGATWVYDVTERLWHERGDWDGLQYVEIPTRGNAYIGGNPSNVSQYTISRTTGEVFYQSTAYYVGTDGLGIKRLRRAPHLCQENKGTIIDRVELKFEPGVALANGAGSNPHWAMRHSSNGGQTWSNTRTASMGRTGEYSAIAEWRGLGYGRDRLIEITTSDPVFAPIIDAFVDVRTGAS